MGNNVADHLDKLEAIVDRHTARTTALGEAAFRYSLLALTNLIIINAGGLLALANDAAGVTRSQPIIAGTAAGLFILGLCSAIACAYGSYLNSVWRSELSEWRQVEEIEALWAYYFDGKSDSALAGAEKAALFEQRFSPPRREIDAAERVKVLLRGNDFSFWFNQITGILSGVSFIAACLVLVLALSGSQA